MSDEDYWALRNGAVFFLAKTKIKMEEKDKQAAGMEAARSCVCV